MIKNAGNKYKNTILLSSLLPLISGCRGGGIAALGNLLSGGGSAVSAFIEEGGSPLSNPEPTSLLLVGSGMAAIAYFKSRSKRDSR